jgi:flagellin-specific chaperone FliS
MIIAKEKRRNNIAEYIIYMWHVEDLVRAFGFDIDKIQQNIVDGFKLDAETSHTVTDWYESILQMMRSENITETGHLQMVKNTIGEVSEVHQLLLQSGKEQAYMRLFFQAKPNITAFRSKLNNNEISDIEVCLNALYSLLLMKMKGQEISTPTLDAMDTFSNLLALLSAKYKEWEEGKLEI